MARRLRQKEPAGAAHPGALSSERALHAPEGALNPPLFECAWRRPTELTHARRGPLERAQKPAERLGSCSGTPGVRRTLVRRKKGAQKPVTPRGLRQNRQRTSRVFAKVLASLRGLGAITDSHGKDQCARRTLGFRSAERCTVLSA